MAATPSHPAAKLRALLARPNEIIVCPGVYDGLTARIALRAGFECLYMVCTSVYSKFFIMLDRH